MSGIALGPNFASRRRASSLVNPPFEMIFRARWRGTVDGDVCASTCLDWSSAAPTLGDDDVPGRDRLPWRAPLVTGPCRCRRRRNIPRRKRGHSISARARHRHHLRLRMGRRWKIFGRRGCEASGSELTAIHEGVDVALRQRFFQTVLRGALGNEIILVCLSEDRSSSENLPHFGADLFDNDLLSLGGGRSLSRVEVCSKRHIGWVKLSSTYLQNDGEICWRPVISSRSTQSTSAWQILNSDDVLAPDVVDWSVLIVVVVIGVISVAAMIVPVIGHRISDCRAPNPTHDRADRTANNSPGDSAPDPSSDRAAFVGKGNLR